MFWHNLATRTHVDTVASGRHAREEGVDGYRTCDQWDGERTVYPLRHAHALAYVDDYDYTTFGGSCCSF